MLNNRKKYFKIFLTTFLVLILVNLFVIDSYSPLGIEFLRVSWFGKVWNAFLVPGFLVVFWPLFFLYEKLCLFLGGCIGILDGGPGEPYFFFGVSFAVAILYAGILTGVVYGIDRVRHR